MTLVQRRLRAFRRNRSAMAGLAVVGCVVAVALFADLLAGFDPKARVDDEAIHVARLAPSWEYLLGTDTNGFDVFSRLVHGARTSLLTAFASIGLALCVGIPVGAVAGWRGGMTESAVMRATDVMLSFPSILIAVCVAAIRDKQELATVIYAVAVVSVPPIIRQVRAAILQVKECDYVTAARAAGLPAWRILFLTALPNCLAPIIVLASLGTGVAILDAAGLSFLGLGPPPDEPEWGVMLTKGFQYAMNPDLWFLLIPPGAAIAFTVLGFNLLGDGLRDALDPRAGSEG